MGYLEFLVHFLQENHVVTLTFCLCDFGQLWPQSTNDTGDTTEQAVSFNETTPEPVEETETAENTENTEKSVNAIRAAEISIYTQAYKADETTNREDSASDKDNSLAEKVAVVAKGEAAKASNTGTNLESLSVISATTETILKRG